MAAGRGDWIVFTGNYACRVVDVCHLYTAGEATRIVLKNGGSFHVYEKFEDVVRVLIETKKD